MRVEVAVFFLLLGLSFGQSVEQPTLRTASEILGEAGAGNIFYQTNTAEYIQFKNVLNPIRVSITYGVGSVNYPAHICLNPFASEFTISGVHMGSTCSGGGLGYATNTSTVLLSSQKDSDPRGKTADVYSTETTPASIYTKPNSGNQAGFVVTIPASDLAQQFSLTTEWYECDSDLYPVGSMNSCVEIPTIDTEYNATVQILSGGWAYYQISTSEKYDPSKLNAFTVSFNQTDDLELQLYVQQGYYPTSEWYMNAEYQYNEDEELSSANVWSPTGKYFIGIYNSATSTKSINLRVNSSECDSDLQGYNCNVGVNATGSPLDSIVSLSASVNLNSTDSNNGTKWAFDFSDDEGLVYFTLDNFPNYSQEQMYVRVSVANNDISDPNGAPGLFAKKGSLPSEQSNHLNVSTVGDVSHQILIPFTYQENMNPSDRWYIAVKIPVDFSIWVGVNCANNCSDGKHGECYCGAEPCMNVTNNGEDLTPFYKLPHNIQDSGGSCNCNDGDYSQSYLCSEKNNGYIGVYLTLLAVMVLIVIAFAVAVPLICVVYKKKNSRYHRETINYDTI